MTSYTICHVFNDPKFSSGFFDFLKENNVDLKNQFLIHYRCRKGKSRNFGMDAIFSPHFFSIIPNLRMLSALHKSEKILIHSLASPFLLFYLFLFPSLVRKSYWVIWGKDLYYFKTLESIRIYHRVYEYFRKKVIKNIPHIITFTRGDYELARDWYGTNAKWHKSFMYPSNLYKAITSEGLKNQSDTCCSVRILVGNSADPSNNHEEIINELEGYAEQDIELIVPLSYGDKKHAQRIISMGYSRFGNKFKPIQKIMPLNEYNALLQTIDIGVFAHKRQQAMGNIITLLGMGKKVYIRSDITSWDTLLELGLIVYDVNNIDLHRMSSEDKEKNQSIIKRVYSESNLLSQWYEISASSP